MALRERPRAATCSSSRSAAAAQFVSAWSGLGQQLPFVVLIFFPRLCLSMLVVAAGQLCRGVAKILDTSSSYQRKKQTCAS